MTIHETYAQALWQLIAGGMKPKEAVEKLHAQLSAEGRENVLPHVARAFRRIAEREMQKSRITLTVARKKDEARAMREVKAALKALGADTADVTLRVDDTLIGGWRLEGREYLEDASFKKQLLSLYNRATK